MYENDFEQICVKYEHMTFEERKDLLKGLIDKIIPEITPIPDGQEAFKVIIRAALGADGDLQDSEYDLLDSVLIFDTGFLTTQAKVKEDTELMMSLADEMVDKFGSLSEDIKFAMVAVCLCIVSADKRIDLREKRFIKKLLKE